MLSVDQHAQIRQLFFLEHLSARKIATRLGISRNSVAKALANEQAQTYTLQQPRPKPKLANYQARVDQLLLENATLPKKQRYTSRKIYEVLRTEGYAGSYSTINSYLVQKRKLNQTPKLFLPLEFSPGQDAQVDWYEAKVFLKNVLTTVQVFVIWLAFSKRIFVKAYPAQRQEAFFDGHVQAFDFFGGVPNRISYDNLAAAVRLLADGRTREESRAFTAFKSYHLFESHFCTPGQGHEKGGVEASAGFSRRNFFVPLPKVASFEELNAQLYQLCLTNDARTVARASAPIGKLWEQERPFLRPLPLRPFDCCVRREATLNPYSQITFETNRYSVPVEQARQKLVVKAYPFRVDIFPASVKQSLELGSAATQPQPLASHPRCYLKEQDIFNPVHYLALLEQRPGAFEYAKPLKQWQQEWPPVYHRVLQLLQEKWPEGRGVKEFVRILKLHQDHAAKEVETALYKTLEWGCLHYDGVLQALQHTGQALQQLQLQLNFKELDLADKPHLANVKAQTVDLNAYNQLLTPRAGQPSQEVVV
jgi:transposase